MRCTKVDFPEPAIPMAMIQTGFFFVVDIWSREWREGGVTLV